MNDVQENSKAQVMLATYEQLSLLLRLHQSGLLSPATTATLYALREAEDQNLLAAFAAFRQDQVCLKKWNSDSAPFLMMCCLK